MEDNDIKSLTPIECPQCHNTLIVEFVTAAPKVMGTYTAEMIEKAKKDALAKIELLEAPDELKKPIVEWINNPETIFSPNDLDEIIKNIKKQTGDESKEEDEEVAS